MLGLAWMRLCSVCAERDHRSAFCEEGVENQKGGRLWGLLLRLQVPDSSRLKSIRAEQHRAAAGLTAVGLALSVHVQALCIAFCVGVSGEIPGRVSGECRASAGLDYRVTPCPTSVDCGSVRTTAKAALVWRCGVSGTARGQRGHRPPPRLVRLRILLNDEGAGTQTVERTYFRKGFNGSWTQRSFQLRNAVLVAVVVRRGGGGGSESASP